MPGICPARTDPGAPSGSATGDLSGCIGDVTLRPLRILHVTHQYRPALGGSEQHVINSSEELARRGHQVDVFTTRSLDYRSWRNELPGREQLAGVDVRRFRSIPRTRATYRLLEFGYGHYQPRRARLYEPLILYGNGPVAPGLFLSLLLRGGQYDVVHVNTMPYAHVWYTALAARWRRLPLVITPFLHVKQAGIFDVEPYNAALRRADIVMAMTRTEQEYLVARRVDPKHIRLGGVGVQPSELIPEPRGIWREHFGIPEGAYAVLFVGRRADYKGLDTLLAAFAALRREDERVVLLVAGPTTPYWEALRARYAGLDGIIDCGQVSDTDKARLLDACDLLALPSTGESFGIVFVEAWTLGKPVIGARSGAVADMIAEGQDGLLIAPGDAEELACKIAMLKDNAELSRYLGEQGRQKVQARYTVARVTDDLERIYTDLAQGRAQRSDERKGDRSA